MNPEEATLKGMSDRPGGNVQAYDRIIVLVVAFYVQDVYWGLCLYLLTKVLLQGKEFNWIGTKRGTLPPKLIGFINGRRQGVVSDYIQIGDLEDVQYQDIKSEL